MAFRFAMDVEMENMSQQEAAEIASVPIGVDLMLEDAGISEEPLCLFRDVTRGFCCRRAACH